MTHFIFWKGALAKFVRLSIFTSMVQIIFPALLVFSRLGRYFLYHLYKYIKDSMTMYTCTYKTIHIILNNLFRCNYWDTGGLHVILNVRLYVYQFYFVCIPSIIQAKIITILKYFFNTRLVLNHYIRKSKILNEFESRVGEQGSTYAKYGTGKNVRLNEFTNLR